MQKFINSSFYLKNNKDFNLDEAIIEGLEYHNNAIHSSTNFSPIELRDIEDEKIIETVRNNILNNVGKKIEKNNENLLKFEDKLLISTNLEIKNKTKELFKKSNSRKGRFIIPALFKKYLSGNKLKIQAKKNYNDIIVANTEYIILRNLVRLVNDDVFEYFMENDDN